MPHLARTQNRLWSLFSILTLLLAAGWIWLSRPQAGSLLSGADAQPWLGFQAPDLSLDSLSGEHIRLSDLRGQPVVLNFWASWCLPCRAEMPALERVYQDYQSQGLVILGVNATSQDDLASATAFVKELGLSFPILLDVESHALRAYQISAYPTTYFIDRLGIIQQVVVGGPMSEALLRSYIEELIGATP